MNQMNEKSAIQEGQYDFPYHHIPYWSESKGVVLHRCLAWGFEYYAYVGIVAQHVRELKPESLLEIGCGDGALLHRLEGSISRLSGIDLSSRAIGFANAFCSNAHCEVRDVRLVAEKFDVIALVEVLEHIPESELEDFMRSALSCVRSDGYAVISVPTNVRSVHRKHYRHYTEALLAEHLRLAAVDYEVVESGYFCRDSILFNQVRRLFLNKYWYFYSTFSNKLLWDWYSKRILPATKDTGSHLVQVIRVVG